MGRVYTGTLCRFFLLGPGTHSILILQVKHCNQMGNFQLSWLPEEEGCEHLCAFDLYGTVSLDSATSDFSFPAPKGLINVGN